MEIALIAATALSTLSTFVLAWIAWKQYQTTKLLAKQALYEKRLAVYNKTRNFVRHCLSTPLGDCDAVEFSSSVEESRFLFGEDVDSYLTAIFDHANRLWYFQAEKTTVDNREDYEEMMTIRKWFSEQNRVMVGQFNKYLQFALKEST